MEKKQYIENVGKILVSPSKLGVVVALGNEPKSFTNIKRQLNVTSGSLNYHLLFLQKEGLVKKTDDKQYALSDEGRQVLKIVKRVISKE